MLKDAPAPSPPAAAPFLSLISPQLPPALEEISVPAYVIDSSGRIMRASALFERTTETMDIRTDSTRSFYSRYGDIFSYLCIVAGLTILLLL